MVLKDSMGRRDIVQSLYGTASERLRERLLAAGTLRVAGDNVIFDKDHLFQSPSTAATILTGRSANGWTEWKAADGRTLDAVKRQGVAQ